MLELITSQYFFFIQVIYNVYVLLGHLVFRKQVSEIMAPTQSLTSYYFSSRSSRNRQIFKMRRNFIID